MADVNPDHPGPDASGKAYAAITFQELPMHRFSPLFSNLRSHPLAGAVTCGLLLAAPAAFGGVLNPGSHTVNMGDPLETWRVEGRSTLTITPEGQTYEIVALGGASLIFDGALVGSTTGSTTSSVLTINDSTARIAGSTISGTATFGTGSTVDITGSVFEVGSGSTTAAAISANQATVTILDSTVRNASGSGISMGGGTGPGTLLTMGNTDVTGVGVGLSVGGGATAVLDYSRITGTSNPAGQVTANGHGMNMFRGDASLLNGSVVTGANNGAYLALNDRTGLFPGATLGLTVDRSAIVGETGSGILVANLAGSVTPTAANIVVRNGASVTGGNGNVLEVTGGSTANLQADASALMGNVVADAASTTHLAFQNDASLTGALTNVTSMTLADSARWDVTADSSVGSLDLGSGTLAFAAPSPGFKTVTVAGDLAINGGVLIFNSVLGDDRSPSDKLVVNGDTSGSGSIVVNNLGGAGAKTGEGIQLISVGGTSGAALVLNGRAVAGADEYFLYKGGVSNPGDGGWYLRSSLVGDPCDMNPGLPICTPVDPVDPTDPTDPVDPVTPVDPGNPGGPVDPPPVLRPEPGAYLANQAAAVRMFQQRRDDRGNGTSLQDRPEAWARVSRDQLQTTIGGQVDARSHSNVLQIGSDVVRWGQRGRGQAGIMLATGEATTQATSNMTGYGTRGKVRGDALGVYGTWVQQADDSTGMYVDGWLQYGRYDSQVQGDGLALEKYKARTRTAQVEAGYSWAVVDNERAAWYVQPQVQVGYTDYKGDTHQEVNGTIVEDARAGGLESRVGVRLFGHDQAAGNRVQPFFAVNWLHAERGDAMRFDGERVDANLPTNRYEAQAGAQLRLGLRWSAWGDMRVQRGDGGYKEVAGQIGLRRAW